MGDDKKRLRANPLALENIVNAAIGDVQPEVIEREVIVYQDNPDAIQRHGDGSMTYKRFTMTPTGLVVPDDVQSDELVDVAKVIIGLQSSIQWIVGDLMNSMKRMWGDSYQRVAAQLGYEVKTVQEWASICRNVSIRMETLKFGHHQLVSPLEPDMQWQFLKWAADNSASVNALRKEIADWKIRNTPPRRTKLHFSPAATESEHHSYVHLTRIRNAINGKQTLSAEQVLKDAIKLKEFAEQAIRDMSGG